MARELNYVIITDGFHSSSIKATNPYCVPVILTWVYIIITIYMYIYSYKTYKD